MVTKNSLRIKRVLQSVTNLFAPLTLPRTGPAIVDYKASVNASIRPTGFRTLDKALNIGGLPAGTMVELMGSNMAASQDGTACIAARIAAKIQRQQGIVMIIDMNHSFDTWQADRCGLTASHLLLARPDTVFTAVTSLEQAAHQTDMVIITMGVVAELLRDIEVNLLKTLIRRLQNIVKHSNGIFLFLTVPHEKDPFSPTNYPPGFPLGEIADLRLWIQDESWTHKDGLTTAYKANLTVIKNELALAGKGAAIRIKLDSF